MQRKRFFGKGFTLIELLVVILILAILAALIVPNLMKRGDEAKIAKAKSDITTLSNLVQSYKLDTGEYPSNDVGLDALRSQPSGVTGWQGPYTRKEIPMDPWGIPYHYEYPAPDDESTFAISSYGPDKQPGTDDVLEGGQQQGTSAGASQ